jgi:predicted lipoprotein with Yx(FWY)xxD motif
MTPSAKPAPTRRRKRAAAAIVATAGFVVAALVGVALAKTFTLKVAKKARVTNQSGTTKSESIAVNSRGFAVYMLTGDSKAHPKCTKGNSCFSFWPPLKVASSKKLSKAPGIKGKLGVWHRNGFFQVTLAGHPLYRYSGDRQKNSATGEGVRTFGGTWHAVKAGSTGGPGTTPAGPPTTTTTPYCLYPPC